MLEAEGLREAVLGHTFNSPGQSDLVCPALGRVWSSWQSGILPTEIILRF